VSTKRNRACEPLTAQEFDKIDEVVFELPNVVDIAAAPPRLIVPTEIGRITFAAPLALIAVASALYPAP
jgi:hypothetical protein